MLISMLQTQSSSIVFAQRFAVRLDIRFIVTPVTLGRPCLQPLNDQGQQVGDERENCRCHDGRVAAIKEVEPRTPVP
jgi:hypothetical protein